MRQYKQHVDGFIEKKVLPYPVAFSKNRYVITVILVLSVASLVLFTNQSFTNFVSCVFNGIGTLVALIIAYEADKNEALAAARSAEIERRALQDHVALMELIEEMHKVIMPIEDY